MLNSQKAPHTTSPRGELWEIYCEYFGENCPMENSSHFANVYYFGLALHVALHTHKFIYQQKRSHYATLFLFVATAKKSVK